MREIAYFIWDKSAETGQLHRTTAMIGKQKEDGVAKFRFAAHLQQAREFEHERLRLSSARGQIEPQLPLVAPLEVTRETCDP